MRITARVATCVLALFVVFGIALSPANGQTPSPAISIKSIEVRGNRRVDRSTILFYIQLSEGKMYTNVDLVEKIRKDVKTIYELGFFRDVRVDVEPFEGGLKVVYIVSEKPTISAVEIVGNSNVELEKIRERVTVKVQTIVNEATVKETVRNIRSLYQEKGYYFARIEAVLKEGKQNNVKVTLRIDEGESAWIETITFRGNKSISRRKILSVMDTGEWDILSWITAKGIYREDELQRDLIRIRILYQSKGFLKVQVGQPIVREDRERGRLNIIIPITEGFVYRLGTIEIRGGEDVIPPEELKAKMKLFPGDLYNRNLMVEDNRMITTAFANRGYAFVNVRPVTIPDDEKKTVDIRFNVNKGRRVYIGRVNLKGNTRTRDNVVRREVRVTEGALYNATGLANTRKRLNRTGYFGEVKVVEKRRPGRDDILDIDVEVEEKPTGSISGGLGFNSSEGGVATISVQESNLLGKGYNVSVGTRVSQERLDFLGSFTDPDFQDRGFSLGGDVFFNTEEFDAFTGREQGGRIRVGKELAEFLNLSFAYELSNQKIIRVEPFAAAFIAAQANKDFLTSSVTPTIVYDTRNRRILPDEGTLLQLSSTVSGGPLGGDSDIYFLFGELRQYYSVGKMFRVRVLKKLVFSYRVQARFVDAYRGDLPVFNRLFLSGRNIVRGFERDDLGPKDAAGNAVGGNATGLISLELTHPLIGPVSGAVFLDLGNVWERSDAFDVSDVRVGGGFGMRVITPLGPLRLDIGYKLDKKSDERAREVHFGIGTTF